MNTSEDLPDFVLGSTPTSGSPMSTIFDSEPYRLSWDSAFDDNTSMFQSFSVGPLKEETYDIFDLSSIPLSDLPARSLLDATDSTNYAPSRAPFGGLVDLGALDCLYRPTGVHNVQKTAAIYAQEDKTSELEQPKLSSSGDRSPFRGCSTRKRKSCDSTSPASSRSSVSPPSSPVHKKTSHNMIEKRYRTNLNEKILALRNAVPALRAMAKNSDQQADDGLDDGQDDLNTLASAQKLSKATILCKATEYIRSLEKKNDRFGWENAELRRRVTKLETVVLSSVNGFTAPTAHG